MTAPAPPRLELFCSACGYGIVCRALPTVCPMCRAVAPWREIGARRLRRDLDAARVVTAGF